MSGAITRPTVCEKCGRQPKRHLDAHHADYSKPFEVGWLCRACHTHIHPHAQVNVPVEPWAWDIGVGRDEMADAMRLARDPDARLLRAMTWAEAALDGGAL